MVTCSAITESAFVDPNDLSRLSPDEMEALATGTFAKLRQTMTPDQILVFEELLDRAASPSLYCECGYDY